MNPDNNGTQLERRGIFVHLSHGVFGIRRKVSTSKIEVKDERKGEEVDKKQLNVTKALLDSEAYRAIHRLIHESRSWLAERAIHVPHYREGYFFIALENAAATIDGLEDWKKKIEKAADDFAFKEYAKAKREAKTRLGVLYNESDYPSEQYVRRSIFMSWDYKREDVPETLKKLGTKVFESAVKKNEAKAQELLVDMKYLMRQQLQELVAHLADRLAPDEKGERKVFRDSAITNVLEWLSFFDSKNSVTDDGRMADLAKTLRKQLDGVDVKQIRDDDAFRKQLEKDMTRVKSTLDGLMKDAPSRIIARRDEEV